MRDHRGIALLAALGVGMMLTLSVAGYILIASHHSRTGHYTIERLKARAAADAGIAWAQAQLLPNTDPNFQAPAAVDLVIPYPNGPQDMNVDVIIECADGSAPPCATPGRRIRSRVNYEVF